MAATEFYLGRQPIFDLRLDTVAYELLYRPASPEPTGAINGEMATSQVLLNSLVHMGLQDLVGNRLALVNVTRAVLLSGELANLPRRQLVLEILEDVVVDDVLIDAVTVLAAAGHRFALDDFVYRPELDPLIERVEFIKFDVLETGAQAVGAVLPRIRTLNPAVSLLAEKVETRDQFNQFRALGFQYFQGYFLARPELVRGHALPPGRLNVAQLMRRVHDPEVSLEELGDCVARDISLSHKVLRYINSPASGLGREVQSIQQAVVLLGLDTVKNWISIIAMSNLEGNPTPVMELGLTRARCCELLARSDRRDKPDSHFTLGMFSVIDALLGQPMVDALQNLPLHSSLKQALLERTGPYAEALNCALALENPEGATPRYGALQPADIAALHLESMRWTRESLGYL